MAHSSALLVHSSQDVSATKMNSAFVAVRSAGVSRQMISVFGPTQVLGSVMQPASNSCTLTQGQIDILGRTAESNRNDVGTASGTVDRDCCVVLPQASVIFGLVG